MASQKTFVVGLKNSDEQIGMAYLHVIAFLMTFYNTMSQLKEIHFTWTTWGTTNLNYCQKVVQFGGN